jgi:hypothetical protein
MTSRTAITVNRPREALQREWRDPEWVRELDARVTFRDAPGDRGTEIHVELGRVGLADRLKGGALPKVKNELRRFKQRIETGEIPRSDAIPEGERVERKFRRRPAQPPAADDRAKAGVS